MQRCNFKSWIAKFLVLVMLMPALGPVALAQAAPMGNLHCVRKPVAETRAGGPAVHCHEGLTQTVAGNDGQATREPGASFRSLACCSNHDCCRAVKASEWARPASNLLLLFNFLTEPSFHVQVKARIPVASTGPASTRAPPIS